MEEINTGKGFVWYQRYWRPLLIILFVLALSAAVILFLRHPLRSHEIILTTDVPSIQKIEISVSGEVERPGIYLVNENDTINDIVKMAGGHADDNYSNVTINLSPSNSVSLRENQKININNASEWLLDALPGIGAEKAKLIIDYREQNGPFKYIEELKKVPGIGNSIFDGFKDFITVVS